MGAQVKLQWTKQSQVVSVTQTVQKRVGDEIDWTDLFYDGSITENPDIPNQYSCVDTSITYPEETVVYYRVLTSNGTYDLPSNVVSVTVGAEVMPVNDLQGTIEVVE